MESISPDNKHFCYYNDIPRVREIPSGIPFRINMFFRIDWARYLARLTRNSGETSLRISPSEATFRTDVRSSEKLRYRVTFRNNETPTDNHITICA